MKDLIINRPDINDVLQIHELFSITIKNNFKEEGVLNTLEEEANNEIETLKQNLQFDFDTKGEKEHFLIAKLSDQVLGTIAFGAPNSIVRNHLKLEDLKIPEVKSVYVLPGFQGKGIGSLLLKVMLRLLKDKKINAFYLDSGYRKAQQFWKRKLGDPTWLLPDYWPGGNPHMIWHKRVDDLIDI